MKPSLQQKYIQQLSKRQKKHKFELSFNLSFRGVQSQSFTRSHNSALTSHNHMKPVSITIGYVKYGQKEEKKKTYVIQSYKYITGQERKYAYLLPSIVFQLMMKLCFITNSPPLTTLCLLCSQLPWKHYQPVPLNLHRPQVEGPNNCK